MDRMMISVSLLSSIVFVILAWFMLRRANVYSSASRYFSAILARITGAVCIMFSIVAILVPCIVGRVVVSEIRTPCMNNLSQIGKALCMYSMDHNEQYPPDLQTLAIEMKLPLKLFVCPMSKHVAGSFSNLNEWTDYVYIAGFSATNQANVPIAVEAQANHNGKGHVLYNDGSVWVLIEAELKQTLQMQLATKSGKQIP